VCGVALSAFAASSGWLSSQLAGSHPSKRGDRVLSSTALRDERKQVTVLFADTKGSMELLADRDPEEARAILDPVLELLIEAVHRYEGTVNQVMGDGIMALFGAPFAQEDHAVRASYAALRMQQSVKQYAEEVLRREGVTVRIRIGMDSGEVVVRSIVSDLGADYTAVGQTTHLAARMEQMADPGSILITGSTHELAQGFVRVKPLGRLPVRGLSDAVEVFEVTGVDPVRSRLHAAAAHGLSPLVNRRVELEQIHAAMARAADGHGMAIVLMGEPGVGKSRLVWEVTHSDRTQGWLVLQSRAAAHATDVPYHPVSELLRGFFHVDANDDAPRIRRKVTDRIESMSADLQPALPALLALLDTPVDDARWNALDPPRRREQILDAVGRVLVEESRARPVLAVFEDSQWSDAETQHLLDGLVDRLPGSRLAVLVNCRPERHPSWHGRSSCVEVPMQGLDRASAAELLRARIGDDSALTPVRQLLIDRTEGNPFFMEESVRILAETGVLAGERGAYRLGRQLPPVPVAATVQAVIAARIDRLAEEDKRLLQTAAVIGRDVRLALLRAVSELPEGELRLALQRLQAAEFLYETSQLADLEYTFRHSLTHDVAYGSLLQEQRRVLHAAIADAIERLSSTRADEGVEQLAHHTLRGGQWAKAVVFLQQAARKAAARSAYREAAARLDQALEALAYLPASDATRQQAIDVRLDLRATLTPLGDHSRILTHLREAEPVARALGDPRRLGRIYAYLADCYRLSGELERAIDFGEQARVVALAHHDLPLQIAANMYLGQASHNIGQHHRAIEFLRSNLELLVGDLSRDMMGLPFLSSVHCRTWLVIALAEVGQFAEAVRTGEEGVRLAEMAEHFPSLTSALAFLGVVHVRRGDAGRAIPPLERAGELARTWSVGLLSPMIDSFLGSAYVLRGQPADALPLLERAVERQRSMRRQAFHSQRVTALADVRLALGQVAQAAALAEQALTLSRDHGERGSETHALRLLADIAAASEPTGSDRIDDAYRLALGRAEILGMQPVVARCRLGLGHAAMRAARRDQAAEHLGRAAEDLRRMGMTRWLEEAEDALRRLG
jgi:class 3 adenylate cyclase/tetratricopeptide (TPR) repeat protein